MKQIRKKNQKLYSKQKLKESIVQMLNIKLQKRQLKLNLLRRLLLKTYQGYLAKTLNLNKLVERNRALKIKLHSKLNKLNGKHNMFLQVILKVILHLLDLAIYSYEINLIIKKQEKNVVQLNDSFRKKKDYLSLR